MKQINSNIVKNIRVRSYTHSISKDKQPIKQDSHQTPEKSRKKSPSMQWTHATGIVKLLLSMKKEPSKNNISSKNFDEPSNKRVLKLGKQNRPHQKKEPKQTKILITNPERKQTKFTKTLINQNPPNIEIINVQSISKSQILSYNLPNIPQTNPSSVLIDDDKKSISMTQEQDSIFQSKLFQIQDLSFRKFNSQITGKCNFLSVQNVFSVTIQPLTLKQDIGVQTITFQLQDKYYVEYIKYRQLKSKSFQEIMDKQQKLKNMIRQSQQFNKHYDNLMKYVNEGPQNDREKRVYALSVDLEKHERKIEVLFDRIFSVGKGLQKILIQKSINQKKKSKNLLQSIQNLLMACIKQLEERKSQKNENLQFENCWQGKIGVVQRILGRVSCQFKYFEKFHFNSQNYGSKVIQAYENEGLRLKRVYDEWKSMQYQNRVLLYNFMKQIQKIPSFTVSLFGYDENESIEEYLADEKKYVEKKFEDYMVTRCERCFEMKNKIKLMQHNNNQIKPVFKVVEWLVRDAKKQQNSLSLI